MENHIKNAVSLFEEMVTYETLWAIPNQTVRTISELFAKNNEMLPSQLLRKCAKECLFDDVEGLRREVENYLKQFNGFSVCVNGTFQYPPKLRHAKYPIELFYYKGDIGLVESRCVSIVGTRKCTKDGVKRARKLASGLVEKNYAVVSGLAEGIDTAAMTEAIKNNGNTIGVIGTPINQYYPKENKEFQDYVATNKLLISQVPFYRYNNQPFKNRRFYFPQRNETMAALSEATVIVEASDTSGSLTQARACLHQGRKLFILDSCFKQPNVSWPFYYEKKGAIRVKDFDDIFSALDG